MSINGQNVYTIVVTYNRKMLLDRCIRAILAQTQCPDKILIIDNASTDGTDQMLSNNKWDCHDLIEIVHFPYNIGGAGGFSRGIEIAIEMDADYMWIMDDDAIPELNSLEILLQHVTDNTSIYGSLPTDGAVVSWPLTCVNNSRHVKGQLNHLWDVNNFMEVQFLPFIGLLISKEIVDSIGLPDSDYFLAADDVEYCLRAKKAGFKTIVIATSRIYHPAAKLYFVRVPFKTFHCLKLSPWKRYYDVRNRLFLAKKHYGMVVLCSQTIPSSLLRYFATLLYEPEKWLQTKAFLTGMVDGLLNKKGCRHGYWGL
jgi:GT2 family glycosyltransferase